MKPAMKRKLRLAGPAIAIMIFLAACHQLGGGYAERADVPLSVSMTVISTPQTDCRRVWCAILFKAIVTDEGTQPVFARDCWLRALDKHGKQLLERRFGVTIGPGIYTEPGKPGQTTESLVQIRPKQRANIKSVEGTCLAYIWHGSVPI
jgi:hypothetical protein